MLIADLSKEFPYDTLLNQMRLPEARALISLQHNQPAQAVAALDSAKPYELGTDRRVQGKLSAIDIRAQAFLQVRDGVRRRSIRKFSTIAALIQPARSVLWLTWAWAAPMRSRAIPRRRKLRTRISSRSGKARMRTFRS
jgi:hypothetical protein